MEQVTELSDKLLSSLDANDTETLHQSLASVSKRLAHVTAASHKRQQLLDTKSSQWHTFQVSKAALTFSLATVFSCFISVCPFVALLKATYAENLHIVLCKSILKNVHA